MKKSIQQQVITLVNTYASNTGEHKYTKLILLKRKIDSNTITPGDFNTPVSALDDQAESQQQKQKIRLNLHYRQNGPKKYSQIVLSRGCRIHILLSPQHIYHSKR